MYKIKSYYKRQQNIEYEQEKTLKSPDIIFIDILSEDILPKNNLQDFDGKLIMKLDKDTIVYNGYKYKLDYIIHHSDDMQTCEKSGHVISAIHYNSKQYYYDSGFSQIRIKCKDECFEIISKFVDTDAQSNGKCFGFSGWGRTVYNRTHLINKLECMFRMNAYININNNINNIEIIKINYPKGYDKNINGIDNSSEHTETVLIKYL